MGTTPVLVPNVWVNENGKVYIRSRESNSGPYDSEIKPLPLDHEHRGLMIVTAARCIPLSLKSLNCAEPDGAVRGLL